MSTAKIMISAGEASGDLHAARLVDAYNALGGKAVFWGMGGPRLAAAGMELVTDCRNLGFIGFIDVILHYRKIMRELEALRSELRARRPDLVILVDYPGWNMKIAHTAKQLGIPVLYYISPQIWAWRPHRIHEIAKLVDMMAVLFPFEAPLYEQAQIPVRFVGHPLLDEVKPRLDKQTAITRFGLNPALPTVALLPGSRPSEIKRILPILLDTAALLLQQHGPLNLPLPIAGTLTAAQIRPYLQKTQLPVTLIEGQAYDVMHLSDAVITSSGTATLETAIIGTPMAIVYRVSWLNYRLMKRLLTIDHIGLANIVAGKPVVQEFIQEQAQPQQIANEISRILEQPDYAENIRLELNAVKNQLGAGGGSEQVARLAMEMLNLAK